MRIRSKVFLSTLLFLTVSGAAMAWCYFNIRREETAFLENRQALKTLAIVTDIEYFLVRQARLLENYVLLGDESERLQLVQAVTQTRRRLDDWDKAVQRGEAIGTERAAVQQVHETISKSSNKIRVLLAAGKRVQAMALTQKEFTPASAQALAAFAAIKQKIQTAKEQAELRVSQKLRYSHMGLMAGLGLVSFFGLVSLLALYRTVILPIQSMRAWADRVARGEKAVPLAGFKGANELTELAQSIGEMAIQLTRPKAFPPPSPVPKEPGQAPIATSVVVSSDGSKPAPKSESQPAGTSSGASLAPTREKHERPPQPNSGGALAPTVSSKGEKSADTAMRKDIPASPDNQGAFEVAVDEFRDLLTQLSGPPRPSVK